MKSPLLFIILALCFCSWKYTPINQYNSQIPVIIDTLEPFKDEYYQINEPLIADYDILYIGLPKDTLWVHHTHATYQNHVLDYMDLEGNYKHITDSTIDLSIFVDTAQIIKDDINVELTLKELVEMDYKAPGYYNAYPVFIQHYSPETVKVGHTGYEEQLGLILEAVDSSGNWRAIEHPFTYMCGFGIHPIVLHPKELLLTAVLIPKGNYKTQFRLNYYGKYSNNFEGSMFYGQFETPIEDLEDFPWDD